MTILVSACLLGCGCRYDGESNLCPEVLQLAKKHTLIPCCPEQLGGLPTPRIPAERVEGKVLTQDGRNVTAAFHRGADEMLRLAQTFGCTCAILKERSPACGCGLIYDGTFRHTLTKGVGVAAQLLLEHGFTIYGESQLDQIPEQE